MGTSITGPFECDLKSCSAKFDTKELLRAHKIKSADHEYCKRCDEVFASDDALNIHKIKSPKHICCPICCESFRSAGGKKLHIAQMHVAEQNIKCIGCSAAFVRAGALIAHIENGDCPVISFLDLEAKRANREALQHNLHALSTDETASALSEGGVPLPHVEGDEAFPKLPTATFKDGDREDLLTGLQSLEIKEPTEAWGEPSATILFPIAPIDVGGIKLSAAVSDDMKSLENAYDPRDPGSVVFQAGAYFNRITGQYKCPHQNCNASHKSLEAFKQHLRSPAHLPDRIRCPSCLRLFNSTTALVQHCESPSNRCRIRSADDYNVALDRMTGGYLEAKGILGDGTVRYEAAEPTW